MDEKKKPPKRKPRAASNDGKKHNDNSASAQRIRLINGLREGPIDTLGARRLLDVLHPAARVQELRRLGFKIITEWTTGTTSEGYTHRIAKYVLISEVAE